MKILVCTDGSEQADRAMRMACEIGAACQAEMTLFGIQETPGPAEALLASLRRDQQLCENRKLPAELVTKAGEPIEEILKRTEELTYDLVVIGATRKGAGGPFSMSAKVYKIIKLIKPPVLVVMGNPGALKRILVCTGGKGYIESAFDLLGKVARGAGASITLLHVTVQPPAIYADMSKLELDLDTVLASNSELGRNLRREKAAFEALGIPTEVRLRQGFVQEEIFQEIRSQRYELVVTGSALSLGPLRTYVLGDVTREVVNRADCPVLVARHTKVPRRLREKLRGFFDVLKPHQQSS